MKRLKTGIVIFFAAILTAGLLPGIGTMKVSAEEITLQKPNGDGTADSPYQISSAGELYWFAGLVNGTLTDGTQQNRDADAVLTKNIKVNENVLKSDGTLAGDTDSFINWTPVGVDYDTSYTGTFDGKNHTVSGLYFDHKDQQGVGLFGWAKEDAAISNVGVIDSYFNASEDIGGVCGYFNCDTGSITNCYNTSTVYGNSDGWISAGGVCGCFLTETGSITNCYNEGIVGGIGTFAGGICGVSYGSIINSYNTGAVSGKSAVGGICGRISTKNKKIADCYNTGTVSGESTVGGVCGYIPTLGIPLTNSYNTGAVTAKKASGVVGGVSGESNGIITNSYNTGTVSGTGSDVGGVCGSNRNIVKNSYYLDSCAADGVTFDSLAGESRTLEQLESGAAAYLLSRGCTIGEGDDAVIYDGSVWGQKLGTDSYPKFYTDGSNKVYYQVTKYQICEHDLLPTAYTTENRILEMAYSNRGITDKPELVKVDKPWTFDEDSGKHICSVCGREENHRIRYRADEASAAITASCEYDYDHKENVGTITLKAPDILVYDGAEKPAVLEGSITGVTNPTVQYAALSEDNTESEYSMIIPESAGRYRAKLTLGTGEDAVSVTVDYSVTQVTPFMLQKPAASAITYGQTLADSTLTGGKATYTDADGTGISGRFVWKNGSIKPVVSDSNTTEYDVMFVPDDAVNYSTVDTKLTIIIHKASEAPDKPVTVLRPAHHIQSVRDVVLSENWEWSDEDKEKVLEDNIPVIATAVYTGADKGNYVTESVSITITRRNCDHVFTAVKAKEATATESGNRAYFVCENCGRYYEDSEGMQEITDKSSVVIPVKDTTPVVSGDSNTSTPGDIGTLTPDIPSADAALGTTTSDDQTTKPAGTKLKDGIGAIYKVTDEKSKTPTVQYMAPDNNAKGTVTIPETITIDNVTYKVTTIADNAFRGNKKIKKVVIGSNIVSIGKNAFAKCTNLTSITIGKNVTKIGKNAFSGCKKLKTIIIKSKKLTTKSVAKGAFSGIGKKTVVKVPKSKYKAYKKLLCTRGLDKKIKVKKL